MAVSLDGNVRMRGDTGPGARVRVEANEGRLTIVAGSEVVGDWSVGDIGVHALNEGFAIRAEGEEFILHTEDDAALADELHMAAATPRLARQVAARHKPADRSDAYPEPEPLPSNLAPIGLGVAGGLVILGGTFLNVGTGGSGSGSPGWIVFVVAGILLIAAAYLLSTGAGFARLAAIAVLAAAVVAFAITVSGSNADTARLTAYAFIAGGLVVGVAVLASGSLRQPG